MESTERKGSLQRESHSTQVRHYPLSISCMRSLGCISPFQLPHLHFFLLEVKPQEEMKKREEEGKVSQAREAGEHLVLSQELPRHVTRPRKCQRFLTFQRNCMQSARCYLVCFVSLLWRVWDMLAIFIFSRYSQICHQECLTFNRREIS